MSENEFLELLHRFKLQQLSSDELELFLKMSEEPRFELLLGEELLNELRNPAISEVSSEHRAELVWSRIRSRLIDELPSVGTRSRMIQRRWIAAAASVLLIASAAWFWMADDKPTVSAPIVETLTTPVEPGKNGAILTLSDGREIVLDSLGNGVVALQGAVSVVLNEGQLAYDASSSPGGELAYNTMTTPKGRQFSLVLPDGTKIWLNAESSIRFPTQFIGQERLVEVAGEAYLEVARNALQPFRVRVNDRTTVEVLGTHFNINSYKDEETINTTLLEGSVRIRTGSNSSVLKPGQQAQVDGSQRSEAIRVLAHVDTDRVVAWKNGVFDFQDASLQEVMRQLERWYNIEVEYEGEIPRFEFIGKMGRDLPLETVLRGLEMSKVRFRLEGRRLIVLP